VRLVFGPAAAYLAASLIRSICQFASKGRRKQALPLFKLSLSEVGSVFRLPEIAADCQFLTITTFVSYSGNLLLRLDTGTIRGVLNDSCSLGR